MINTNIKVPEGATKIKVKTEGNNYGVVLEFNDKNKTHHFWLKNGAYDGNSVECSEPNTKAQIYDCP